MIPGTFRQIRDIQSLPNPNSCGIRTLSVRYPQHSCGTRRDRVDLVGPMQRIAIVGCPGSGKSTLAGQLADKIDASHVELDALFHQSDWEPTPIPEFRAKVSAALSSDRWVVDGNYRPVEDLVQAGADTIIWLDLARWRVMSRIVRRSLRRVITREELWNGNRESMRKLVSRDPEQNVIVWSWQHHPKYRARYGTWSDDGTWASKDVFRLRTPAEVSRFRASLPRNLAESER
jgi:adenylate kinase family enzyme